MDLAKKINPLTWIPKQLTITCQSGNLKFATGYLTKSEGRIYLISNWHVLSGRNCHTGQTIDKSGDLPQLITFPLYKFYPDKTMYTKEHLEIDVPLGNDLIEPIWIEHPSGQEVDIAAVEVVADFPETAKLDFLSDLPVSQLLKPEVASDVFVLGFPLGIAKQDFLPIWKRASIASEPEVSVEKQEKILIDTATREGMSGSPVFAYTKSAFALDWEDMPGAYAVPGLHFKFLGVYSGRYGSDDLFGAQLGIVWKETLINEMLSAKKPGSYRLIKG